MSENKLIEPETADEETVEAAPKKRRKRPFGRWFKVFNIFEWFDKDQIVRNMPFILYAAFLMMCYIANSYYAERLIRQIDKTKLQLRECSAEFVSTRSTMMFETQQSEVAKAAAPIGLVESKEPPKKIVVEKPVKAEEE